TSLQDALVNAPQEAGRFLSGATSKVRLGALAGGTALSGGRSSLAGRSVLVATRDHFAAALALIELDGVARRLILFPGDLPSRYLSEVAIRAGADALVSDDDAIADAVNVPLRVRCTASVTAGDKTPSPYQKTEWVLLTSGTSGSP